VDYLPSLSGLEVLLPINDSKAKELVLDQVDARTVGLHSVMMELGHNTALTNLAICNSVLSHENVQQLEAVLRQNTLQHLMLECTRLGNTALAENDLDDVESANILRETIRRNKTIISLCLSDNAFGRNAAATRTIVEGVRSNTVLHQLDLV
jgi:hypothetical protein